MSFSKKQKMIPPLKSVGRVICVFNDEHVETTKQFYFGSGAIINQRMVLTSAHILKHKYLKTMADCVYFQIETENNRQKQGQSMNYIEQEPFSKKIIKIVRYGIYQNYLKPSNINKNTQCFDLALLLLEQNDIIKLDMTLSIDFDFKFQKEEFSRFIAVGYPLVLNNKNKSYDQFSNVLEPFYTVKNFFFLKNILGNGFSGCPIMIKTSQTQYKIIAIHKGQTVNEGYSVMLNCKQNKLHNLLYQMCIKDKNDHNNFIQITQLIVYLLKQLTQRQEKQLLYQSDLVEYSNILWSKQLINSRNLEDFIQPSPQPYSFRGALSQIQDVLLNSSLQKSIYNQNEWRYIFNSSKNLYLNIQEEQTLFSLLQQIICLDQVLYNEANRLMKRCRNIVERLHLLLRKVHGKTKTWYKQQQRQRQNILSKNSILIYQRILLQLKTGYNEWISLQERRIIKPQFIIEFYYFNNNIAKSYELILNITQDQEIKNPQILFVKAQTLKKTKRFDNALASYIKYVKILDSENKLYECDFSYVLTEVAKIYCFKGKISQSRQLLKISLQIQKKLKGIFSINCLNNIGYQAKLYQIQRQYEQSLDLYKLNLQLIQIIKGNNCYEYAQILHNIGNLYYQQQSFTQALSYLDRSLQIKKKTRGQNTIQCAVSYRLLGIVYKSKGSVNQALDYLKKSLAIRESIQGKNSLECAALLRDIGPIYISSLNDRIYQEKGIYNRGVEYLNKGHEIIQDIYGRQSFECGKSLFQLASVLSSMPEEQYLVCLYLYKSMPLLQKQLGTNTLQISQFYYRHAQELCQMGNFREAADEMSKSIQIRTNLLEKQDPLLVQSIYFYEQLIRQ